MRGGAMKETKTFDRHARGKVIQLDYDWITSLEGCCSYCLTDAQVQMVLSIIDYFGWSTRWYSESGLIDETVIKELKEGLGKALMSGCGCGDNLETLTRITPDGHWQKSNDNGETWQDAPLEDPRRAVPYRPPFPVPVEGEDSPKCQWADSIVQVVKEQFLFQLAEDATVRDIIAALIGLLTLVLTLANVAAILIALTAIPAVIFAFGVVAVQTAFTTDVWNRFRCNIYDNMDANGIGTQAQVDAIYSRIATDETGITVVVLQGIVALFGVQGMANAANAGFGASDADCSDCTPCEGCSTEAWAIRMPETGITGQINEETRTCNIVNVEATAFNPFDGKYYYQLIAPSDADGCVVVDIIFDVNPFDLYIAWDLVGEARGTFAHSGVRADLLGQNVVGIFIRSVDSGNWTLVT